jgi:hypothetical protein
MEAPRKRSLTAIGLMVAVLVVTVVSLILTACGGSPPSRAEPRPSAVARSAGRPTATTAPSSAASPSECTCFGPAEPIWKTPAAAWELKELALWKGFTPRQNRVYGNAYYLCHDWFAHDNDPESGAHFLETHGGAARRGCSDGSNGVALYGSRLPDLP